MSREGPDAVVLVRRDGDRDTGELDDREALNGLGGIGGTSVVQDLDGAEVTAHAYGEIIALRLKFLFVHGLTAACTGSK